MKERPLELFCGESDLDVIAMRSATVFVQPFPLTIGLVFLVLAPALVCDVFICLASSHLNPSLAHLHADLISGATIGDNNRLIIASLGPLLPCKLSFISFGITSLYSGGGFLSNFLHGDQGDDICLESKHKAVLFLS